MGVESNNDGNISDDNEEEEYSEKMEDCNYSG